MIVTSGTPFRFQNYSILSLSWDECLGYCLTTDNCMAVYAGRSGSVCQFFKVGSLKIAKRDNSGVKIGFKIREKFSSTVCPVDDPLGGNGYSFDNYTHRFDRYYNGYSFTYDKESSSWNFNSTGRLGCPLSPQGLFMRAAGPWCIVTPGGDCTSQAAVASKCAAYEGVLSGIDSVEEFNFIKTGMGSIWIGGTRKKSCIGRTTCKGLAAFEFVDPTLSKNPTGYLWHLGKPTDKNCLALTKRNDRTVGIEDVSCTQNIVPDVSGCLAAYACGSYPVLM
ncbi:hypothetical protein CAEBREN_02618 [Caenorhabditis brenneri]|uniref:PAN-3 domain-containing protein n=1 Tax=Caenorhabditis brenneri TaxID=135651 RepID=G0NCJ3_CAEBE|nr:hypothetical protein CAEBREN_02618 [Caenorhabditis brenneri]